METTVHEIKFNLSFKNMKGLWYTQITLDEQLPMILKFASCKPTSQPFCMVTPYRTRCGGKHNVGIRLLLSSRSNPHIRLLNPIALSSVTLVYEGAFTDTHTLQFHNNICSELYFDEVIFYLQWYLAFIY